MDSSSSSVGSPYPGNTHSPENTSPLHSTFVGFPPFGNIQSSEISPPIPSSSVTIPSSEIPQSSQNPQSNPEPQLAGNGSDADWNREFTLSFLDLNFCFFMKTGACEEQFVNWYSCVHRVVYADGQLTECSSLAGVLRDCVFSNQDFHRPILTHFSDRSRRQ